MLIFFIKQMASHRFFIRFRQNTLQLATGMNGKAASAQFRYDTLQLAAGSFIL